jgi:cbb3-type cytochrome oxidase subunit 1
VIRLFGGLLFLTGMLIMVYNLSRTIRSPLPARRDVLPAGLALAGE